MAPGSQKCLWFPFKTSFSTANWRKRALAELSLSYPEFSEIPFFCWIIEQGGNFVFIFSSVWWVKLLKMHGELEILVICNFAIPSFLFYLQFFEKFVSEHDNAEQTAKIGQRRIYILVVYDFVRPTCAGCLHLLRFLLRSRWCSGFQSDSWTSLNLLLIGIAFCSHSMLYFTLMVWVRAGKTRICMRSPPGALISNDNNPSPFSAPQRAQEAGLDSWVVGKLLYVVFSSINALRFGSCSRVGYSSSTIKVMGAL